MASVWSFGTVGCGQAKQTILEEIHIFAMVCFQFRMSTQHLIFIHELPAMPKCRHTDSQLFSRGSLEEENVGALSRLFLVRYLGEPPGNGVVDIEAMSGMFNFVLFPSPKERAVVP